MPKKLPQGNKCIIALDSCALSAIIQTKKILDANPNTNYRNLPASLYFKDSGKSQTQKVITANKFAIYAICKSLEKGYIRFFISPTVLNETLDIPNKAVIDEYLEFIEKYCLMPGVDKTINGNLILVGKEECEELAHLYCSSYKAKIKDKETGEEKEMTIWPPMDSTPDPLNIKTKGIQKRIPKDDAYIMAYASIFRLSLFTLDGKDFVFVPSIKEDPEKRRRGIITINKQYFKEDCYMRPLLPQDIADYYMNHFKTRDFVAEDFRKSIERLFSPVDIGYFEPSSTITSKLKSSSNYFIEDDFEDYSDKIETSI